MLNTNEHCVKSPFHAFKSDHDEKAAFAQSSIAQEVQLDVIDRALIIGLMWPIVQGTGNEWMVRVLAHGSS